MHKQGIQGRAVSIDPTSIIGEVLGEPADVMRNPANAEYLCPFVNSHCTKRSQRMTGPFPVCSVWTRGKPNNPLSKKLICTCPKRFFEVNFFKDVIEHCWVGAKPENPKVSYEVKMTGFGQVDFVIADIDPSTHSVKDFVSVELQAVDIVGSYEPAYSALVSNTLLESQPSYGFNWANVRKRYITQLITKGIFHHHWRTRIVAVIQTPVYNAFRKDIEFDELPVANGNIVFMLYDFEPDPDKGLGAHKVSLDRVVATSHSSLMTGALYRKPPDREAFCGKILANIRSGR